MTFWNWLRDFANRRVRADFMRHNLHDRQCPRCLTWVSEIGACNLQDIEPYPDRQEMTCLKCGHKSRWLILGPAAITFQETIKLPGEFWERKRARP